MMEPDGLQDIAIETKDMNVLELACATGQSNIAEWLLKDCKLQHRRDLKASKLLNERMYLFVPVLKKDALTFERVLQYVKLLPNDVKDLLWLLK
jgi:hypothetical protein